MSTITTKGSLPYDPTQLPRELKRHYISASDSDIAEMLETVGSSSLDQLYAHIPQQCLFSNPPAVPEELSYADLQTRLENLSKQNRTCLSFLGDALPHYSVTPVVNAISQIRNLTTSYTPYQPERSQGTLISHWIYQCLMSQLTGFEAVNSSLYDRSTAIFEAMATAVRLSRNADTIVLSEGIYPQDREVIETLLPGSGVKAVWIPLHAETGLSDVAAMEAAVHGMGDNCAAVVFPQVNHFGLLEDVDALAAIDGAGLFRIAVIDPALLGTGGLKPPTEFGERGVDMIVGEAQHLAIGPNFGGPGLGLFAVRFNDQQKSAIRQTPGRYVGKAKDESGRDCHVMVMSTREQHIRKDKATSNICSNQAFLATLAGASLLCRGEAGMQAAFAKGHSQARAAAAAICSINGFDLAFPESAFANEIVIRCELPVSTVIEQARQKGIHIGVDVSDRSPHAHNLLKISFSDRELPLEPLVDCLRAVAAASTLNTTTAAIADVPVSALRSRPVGLPTFAAEEIVSYYKRLGTLNVSPDTAVFPLGSCTMKYNPYINDWAAGLQGFTDLHPQAPEQDAQGALQLLYEIQEWFKSITGLAGVTTQPVAGAQGELVGIKMFQAYHRDRGEDHRDVVLIPASAHGTNFATAVMAGYSSSKKDGRTRGIVLLQSGPDGSIDMEDLRMKIDIHREYLAAVMITNPNTCGIFESRFHEISEWVHEAGGLVYMDGANMNAIAGWCDLGAMGVDAVHNNLHKTWTIPHGGGGPGDAIVAVSSRLLPYLPGKQIERNADGSFHAVKQPKSVGSFHRHWGNFAHKVRAYTYLLRLGRDGIRRMPAMAVLSARYCLERLRPHFPILPQGTDATPRMHEFIFSLSSHDFARLEQHGVNKALAIPRVGKLFLDLGFHAPTVAWPETYGLMIEPTESYSKAELDRFCDAIIAIRNIIDNAPAALLSVPHFTPIDRVDEVSANRQPVVSELLSALPPVPENRLDPATISSTSIADLVAMIKKAGQPEG